MPAPVLALPARSSWLIVALALAVGLAAAMLLHPRKHSGARVWTEEVIAVPPPAQPRVVQPQFAQPPPILPLALPPTQDLAMPVPPGPPRSGVAACDAMLERLLQASECTGLPAGSRAELRQAYQQLAQQFGSRLVLTPETTPVLEQACRDGSASMQQSLAVVGCRG
jgi:hypothetical protein